MSAPAAVTGRSVAFAYGERTALAGIDFEVAAGAVHGFLGPNGSGKSTLFRLLATLLPPQRGTLTVLGSDVAAEPGTVRTRLGVVFQSPALDRKLTVRENLRYGGHLYGLGGRELAQRIDELLAHARLGERADDRVEELSGGLRRRVEVCKALLHRPRLLLLDEASTGLDPAARRELWQLLRAQPDVTVLFTTHLMDEAEQADRLTLLDEGRIVAEGAPRQLVREIGGQVLELVAEHPAELAEELAGELGEALRQELGVAVPRVVDGAVRIEGEAVHKLVPRIMERCGERVQQLSLAHPSLADVFLHRTGRRFVVAEPAAPPAGRRRRR